MIRSVTFSQDGLRFKVEETFPSELSLDDMILTNGYVGRIEEIIVKEYKDEPNCYVFKCSFVAGNKGNFNWMRGTIENGTKRDTLSHEQGNYLRGWFKVTEVWSCPIE